MSDWDDLEGVTPRISNEDTERLLSGTSTIDDPELADLAGVLRALRGPTEPVELTGLHSVLGAFGAVAVTTQFDPSTVRTRPMLKKLLTGKAIATVAAVTFISAGAAAAAGVVPSPFSAQRPNDSRSAHATSETPTDPTADDANPGTDLDTTMAQLATVTSGPSEADPSIAIADDTDTSEGQGPDVNGPTKFGLCNAYAARTKHDTTTTTEAAATPAAEPVVDESDLPVPFQALQDAADAAGQTVADFCADAVPGGDAHAAGKSDDENPSATAPGKSDDNPSATAPGKSDDNPSATAPGKSDENPSATAPGKSDNPGGGHEQEPPSHP